MFIFLLYSLFLSSPTPVGQGGLAKEYCKRIIHAGRRRRTEWSRVDGLGSRSLFISFSFFGCPVIWYRMDRKPRDTPLPPTSFCFTFSSSSPMSASIARDGVGGFSLCTLILSSSSFFYLSFLLLSFIGVSARRPRDNGIRCMSNK